MELKIAQTSEENELKNKTKKLEKQLKTIEERENKLKNRKIVTSCDSYFNAIYNLFTVFYV